MSSPAAALGIQSLGQVAITVQEVERAIAFYRDTLALPLLFRAGNLAFFDCGGVRLMLDIPEKEEFNHPSSILYFKVGDISATYESLLARNVGFEDKPHMIARMPDHDLWMTFFRDSENNLLGLMTEVRK